MKEYSFGVCEKRSQFPQLRAEVCVQGRQSVAPSVRKMRNQPEVIAHTNTKKYALSVKTRSNVDLWFMTLTCKHHF